MTSLLAPPWLSPSRGWTREEYERQIAARDTMPGAPAVRPPTERRTRRDIAAAEFLRAVGERAPWQADALCREHSGLSFFPERGEVAVAAAAKAVCARCLVRDECLTAAIAGNDDGVWAGTGATARGTTKLQRVTVKLSCIECGTRFTPKSARSICCSRQCVKQASAHRSSRVA